MSAIVLREWSSISPTVESPTRGLFIDDPAARRAIDALGRTGRLVVRGLRDGLEIESRSWVGRVRLGTVDIAVVPKVAPEILIALFRYAYGLGDLKLYDPTAPGEGPFSIADLLIAQLCAEATTLMRRGLHRRYRRREAQLATPRGRIDFAALSRGPLQRAELPCEYHQRDVQWEVNRVVRSGLEFAASLATSPAVRTLARSSARMWSEQVNAIPLELRQVRRLRASLDRMTDRYSPAITLIEMILESTELSIDGDDGRARVPGFLFDMNRFFQDLLSRFLEEHLDGVAVKREVEFRSLFAYRARANPRAARAPALRPDLEVRRGKEPSLLLDAKYRDLWNLDLPREMLYQLAMYAVATPTRRAAIIYPTDALGAREACIDMRDIDTSGVRTIGLRPLILPHLLHVLDGHPGEARALAQTLAFGLEEVGRSPCDVTPAAPASHRAAQVSSL